VSLRGRRTSAALAVAIGAAGWTAALSAALPAPEDLVSNTAARVFEVSPGKGTITKHELRHELAIAAAEKGRRRAPRPGEGGYEQLIRRALRDKLEGIWLYGLGAEMSIHIAPRRISRVVASLKSEFFRGEAEYRHFLKEAHYTRRDVRERVETGLLSERIGARLERKFARETTSKAQEAQAFTEFVAEFNARYRSRTVCAPAVVIDSCSNGPTPAA
jgi:hypothetical protein